MSWFVLLCGAESATISDVDWAYEITDGTVRLTKGALVLKMNHRLEVPAFIDGYLVVALDGMVDVTNEEGGQGLF